VERGPKNEKRKTKTVDPVTSNQHQVTGSQYSASSIKKQWDNETLTKSGRDERPEGC